MGLHYMWMLLCLHVIQSRLLKQTINGLEERLLENGCTRDKTVAMHLCHHHHHHTHIHTKPYGSCFKSEQWPYSIKTTPCFDFRQKSYPRTSYQLQNTDGVGTPWISSKSSLARSNMLIELLYQYYIISHLDQNQIMVAYFMDHLWPQVQWWLEHR